MNETRLREIQAALLEEELDAWFFSDFRGSDPIAARVLGLPEGAMVTRRWFYVIPAVGEPVKVCHGIEPQSLDTLPGRLLLYGRWQEWQRTLSEVLADKKRVAAQYSENGIIPALGKLDAGTADFLRGRGVELCSSGDLVARFEVTCTKEQEAGHFRAMEVLLSSVDFAFERLRSALTSGEALSEYALQQEILGKMMDGGLTTDHPPIVAVNEHAADPHYAPAEQGSAVIEKDSVFLLDLWGKEKASQDAVYADITWCAWTGAEVPERVKKIFGVALAARDAGIAVAEQVAERSVAGWEVDRACRDVIEEAGYGEYFIHRTGHSIYTEDHGNGANMDDYETKDIRRLLPHTFFSIEPGIYISGDVGFRTEVDMWVTESGAEVTGRKQESLPALLA